jgi:hypothetical protein
MIHNIVILLIGLYSGPPYREWDLENCLENLYRHRYRSAENEERTPPIPVWIPRETVR